jgi:hypothetical protein
MSEVTGTRDTSRSIASTIGRSRNRFFRWSDFSGTRSAIEKALSRLVDRDELVRVRGGLYWKGSETPFGMSPPNPREVVAAYADGSPTGPAGLSAANFLGLTTQVPRVPEYAAPSMVPDVDRINIRRRSGRRAEARRKARLGEAEVAFLEVLDAWERVVELPPRDAIERLTVALESGDVDISKVIRAANHEPARSRVRLRALLERSGMAELAVKIRPASAPSVHAAALEPLLLGVA